MGSMIILSFCCKRKIAFLVTTSLENALEVRANLLLFPVLVSFVCNRTFLNFNCRYLNVPTVVEAKSMSNPREDHNSMEENLLVTFSRLGMNISAPKETLAHKD